ncbi:MULTISPECIES: hypothetical protein [unclassified Polaribacter]|uniref:hypothetical protein n=1 Tax=unclassified Polaribacter TaxID=196858 RepID=UPI0011BFBCA4|nr:MULTISPECIES: hypothetical protein [unclassified Polaribacter]TXD51164.1 hypothetical protein ES043_13290 [Polaribacter sp. IC063]TXD56540.1 hypothetical protein ES044_16605 [Polaribacter sp. IC066]
MKIEDLIGKFSIIGNNQDEEEDSYKGTLTLSLDENNRIIAKWLIHKMQEQLGTGFFHSNILVINFNYKGVENKIYKGVVVYKCLTADILEGFWSEKFGDPKFLGKENCFRIKNELIN